jgi:hypothetical protein
MPTCKCLKQNSIENMYLFKQKNQNSEIDFNLINQKICDGASLNLNQFSKYRIEMIHLKFYSEIAAVKCLPNQ